MTVQHLWTRGQFVLTPKGELGMVRAFNRTTNMATVQMGATGLADSLVQAIAAKTVKPRAYMRLHEAQLVEQGLLREYHFSQPRPGKDPNDE